MTKADRARLDMLHRMPCIACGYAISTAHHIVDKGYRKHSGGHQATIPLCRWCHLGEPRWAAVTIGEMSRTVGPSLAFNKRAFVQRYGTERELLAKVNEMIG